VAGLRGPTSKGRGKERRGVEEEKEEGKADGRMPHLCRGDKRPWDGRTRDRYKAPAPHATLVASSSCY